jgi:hypothetical protein|tara:strand:- start:592 stop:1155 length:564 start_codon:yes stop_codon:yes gene_type:complete
MKTIINRINWSYFPKTNPIPHELKATVNIFEKNFIKIDTNTAEELIKKGKKTKDDRLQSDDVLKILEKDFLDINYKIETGKKKLNKIRVPVLFGDQGKTAQAFEVDGWHELNKIVLEVERGRALANNQFLKDIFEASVMVHIDYLVLAVSNTYKDSKDYEKICGWLETLYTTNRIKFELKGILLIGY